MESSRERHRNSQQGQHGETENFLHILVHLGEQQVHKLYGQPGADPLKRGRYGDKLCHCHDLSGCHGGV